MCSRAAKPVGFLRAMAQLILFYLAISLIVAFGLVMQMKREAKVVAVPHSQKAADYVPMQDSSPYRGQEFNTFHSAEGYYSPKRTGVAI